VRTSGVLMSSELMKNVYRHYLEMKVPDSRDNAELMRFHLVRMGVRLWYSTLDLEYSWFYPRTFDRNEQIMHELHRSKGMKFHPKRWWKFWRWGRD